MACRQTSQTESNLAFRDHGREQTCVGLKLGQVCVEAAFPAIAALKALVQEQISQRVSSIRLAVHPP